MNNRIPIYMITSYEIRDEKIYDETNLGFYYHLENAEKEIKDNSEDFFNHYDNYIVIEELFPGIANCGRVVFYKWDSETKSCYQIARPEIFDNECGFFC